MKPKNVVRLQPGTGSRWTGWQKRIGDAVDSNNGTRLDSVGFDCCERRTDVYKRQLKSTVNSLSDGTTMVNSGLNMARCVSSHGFWLMDAIPLDAERSLFNGAAARRGRL